MREFNTFGPVYPDLHYHVDRRAVKAAMREKVVRGRYFTLNAARQTGKTTLFRELVAELKARQTCMALSRSYPFAANSRCAILNLVELDPELEDVLRRLFEACELFQITPRLVGGLAVRGYTRRKRYTHDVDLAIDRQDKANLVAILKHLGFVYRDQTAFKGVKAWQQIGNVTVELHISVDRLWDMRSRREYVLSPAIALVPIDERGEVLTLVPAVEDLLILKLLPLRDQDLADVIALLLDNPGLDVIAFWENCRRTGNTDHVFHQLTELERQLKDGTFRRAWQTYYPEDLSLSEVLSVLQRVQSLKKAKP